MSDPVLRAESIGKKYQLGGNTRDDSRYSYRTLRETLADGTRKLFNRRNRRNGVGEEFWALRGINFEVEQGQVVGIIGRNGAGKSTLLKILSRITEPTTGKVHIKGRVASLLEVGTGFHPELTGRENIYLNGAILGMSRAEIQRKFDTIVEFAEVEEFLDTPVKRYSSGMYVRLAFAVAAHLDPEILVIDEVLAVGDAEFQKKCLGKMNQLSQREGRTVLFVSHQMNAVERLCSRVLWLDKGTLQMDSVDVDQVVRAYLAGGQRGGASSRAEWRNPGNEFNNSWFQPQHLFLADADGAPVAPPLNGDNEIWLHLVADFKKLDPFLVIGYAIYADSGELLGYSCYTDKTQAEWPRLVLGRALMRGKIPSSFLNQGIYRLDLIAALHNREWLFKPGGIGPSVFLELSGRVSDSPCWDARRPGVLAPIMPWEIRADG
jgi:lipopolysaccharide transport system ATP-binding protein